MTNMKNILLKLEVWWAKKFGKRYTNLEDLFKDLNLTDYETHSHRHCPPKDSPCGIEGAHRCCLCKKEYESKS